MVQEKIAGMILDSGASDDMVGHVDGLHGAVSSKTRRIRLGNSKTVHTTN